MPFLTVWMLFTNDTDTLSSSSDEWNEQTFLFGHSDTECNKNDGPLYQDDSINFCKDIDRVEMSDALRWDGTCKQWNPDV